MQKLRATTHDLVFAWSLSFLCGLGHLTHVFPGTMPPWMHVLHNPMLNAFISAAALLGEARLLIEAGRGQPLLCVCHSAYTTQGRTLASSLGFASTL